MLARKYARKSYAGRGALIRRRRARWRAVLRLLIAAFVLGGLGTGVYFALTSPRMVVRQVRVIGANGDLAERIARSVGPRCIGKNIFLLEKRNIVKVSLREPEVARATAHRGLPRTIIVRIRERKPYAALKTGESFYMMDRHGVVFRKCGKPPGRDLPVIILSTPIRIVLGRPCEGAATHALRCILEAYTIGFKIHKISVDPAGDLCLNVVNDFYVKLGPPVKFTDKLRVLDKMLDGKPEMLNHVQYVDLSCPTAPAIVRKKISQREVSL